MSTDTLLAFLFFTALGFILGASYSSLCKAGAAIGWAIHGNAMGLRRQAMIEAQVEIARLRYETAMEYERAARLLRMQAMIEAQIARCDEGLARIRQERGSHG